MQHMAKQSVIRLDYFRAQGGSIALLVSQYAVWAEQWAYQPPWELTSLCPRFDFNWFPFFIKINFNFDYYSSLSFLPKMSIQYFSDFTARYWGCHHHAAHQCSHYTNSLGLEGSSEVRACKAPTRVRLPAIIIFPYYNLGHSHLTWHLICNYVAAPFCNQHYILQKLTWTCTPSLALSLRGGLSGD